ncbi:LmeA family phospholipid-binding protein [Rathayibacter sp. CAU 1779]
MSTQDQPTEPLPASGGEGSRNPYEENSVGNGAGAPNAPSGGARRRRRTLRTWLWVVGAVVVVVGLFFAADAVVRQIAQNTVRDQLEKQLPSDVTVKNLDVTIQGFSVIAQLIGGSLDKVDLHSNDVRVDGNRLSGTIVAHGIPLDSSKPVHRIDGSMTIGQDAVNGLVDLPNDTTVTLNRHEVGLKGTGQILGIDVGYTASVSPTLKDAKTIVLTPLNVSVTAGGGSLDVTRFAKDLLPSTISICVAQYLPDGVDATGLAISKGEAHVSVGADDIVLDEKTMQTKGTCG